MAFSHEFDPARGYVALPSDVMDIEMSPGAFRLLVELCRMANRTGECWPSLGQLSERIGRSKAALSGYIAELRALELLETANQKMANGYNYRLKYCVTFWQNWRAQLSLPRGIKLVQKDECSVQPSECRVNSKNQSHKKKQTMQGKKLDTDRTKLVSVFSKWSDLAKNTPFPQFNAPVPSFLIEETHAVTAITKPQTLKSKALETGLQHLWTSLKVECPSASLKEQVTLLLKASFTETGLTCLENEIRAKWQLHWRKPPNALQFNEFILGAQKSNQTEGMLRLVEQYLKRWELSQNKLQPSAQSHSLALKHAA